jgi:hypothetical protein
VGKAMGVLLAAAAVVELFDGMEMVVLFTEGVATLVMVAKGLSCPCLVIVLMLFCFDFWGQ